MCVKAKLLYAMMLDRTAVSKKNNWSENGNTYIYFTAENAACYLDCCYDTGVKLVKELENAGLIRRRKQGFGKPAKIFVTALIPEKAKETKKTKAAKSSADNNKKAW